MSSLQRLQQIWDPRRLVPTEYQGLFPVAESERGVANHLIPASAEIKNA
jgi:hypothetical protein